MEHNRLLQKQIRRHLQEHHLNDPSLQAFLHAINESYFGYERDKEIVNHAFVESEKEYHLINDSLKKEYELKKQSIANLYDSLKAMDDYENIKDRERVDDIVYISKYLNRQIEKRRETEQELFTTLELLKTLLANLHSGVLVEDQNRNILFSNQMFCDIFQMPQSPESLIGCNCSNSAETVKVLFEDSDFFVENIQSILEKQEPVINQQWKMVDGRFMERDYIPIFIQNEYKGHLWKYTDVTTRIQNEELLIQSEERNRLIMNSALNAIINTDKNGTITFWNNQAVSIFGWEAQEVLGKPLSELIIPVQDRALHYKRMEQYFTTKQSAAFNKQLEINALKNSGVEIPVELSIIPIEQNGEEFFCLFIHDISKRKKAQNELRMQEEKYRNIIANMNLGMLEVDVNNQIQSVNQSFLKLSGFDIDELMGRNPEDFFVFGENVELIEKKRKLRGQGVSDIYQLPIKNKRGELRWWAISGAPNYDDEGNFIGSIGIHLDITDQKLMELELGQEKEKAIEASKAKEAFLANMSHEIRTPLNAIIGFLRELEKEALPPQQRQYIENSSTASKHLLSIINNILDISKIESGEMSLLHTDFELKRSIQNVIDILKPKAIQKALDFPFYFDPKIANVFKGDTMRIEQILFNLIGNSLKFTSIGSVQVACKLQKSFSDFQEICIEISDTGIGMEAQYVKNIFKKFSQEETDTTRKFGGTGLGMSITKQLIELMKGRIEIESEKNQGTTIRVYLNLKLGSLKNIVVEKVKLTNTNLEGINVLLVEDNEFNRMVAQNTLKVTHCTVTEAENGAEAIAYIKNMKFDVILMDIQMPVMDGIAATEIIRNTLNCSTPIIALTANAFKTEIEKCKTAGMNDYVTKPFEEQQLIEKIVIWVSKGEQNNTNQQFVTPKYNLAKLHTLSRGDEQFFRKMIEIFNSQSEQIIAAIAVAIEAHNFQEVSRLIHKAKPSIDELGIESIYNEVRELEEICKHSTDVARIQLLFECIKKDLIQVVHDLKTQVLV